MDFEKIGKYQIVGKIGQGAMGVVYRGWDTRLEMDVAIKVLLADPKDPATSEELKRLVREVKISRALKHLNIVSVYDVDDDAATGRTFIVMEFIQGVPLGSLHTKKILSFQETVTLVGHVANALDYAAQAGVVHRDDVGVREERPHGRILSWQASPAASAGSSPGSALSRRSLLRFSTPAPPTWPS